MSYRVHPVLERKRRSGNRRRTQDNNRRVTEREQEAHRHWALAFLHQLSGHIIDGRDMVSIHGMPKTIGTRKFAQPQPGSDQRVSA